MNRSLCVSAPAKINLHLSVVGRRDDGYHLLRMLNATVDLRDELEVQIERGEGIELELAGDHEGVPSEPDRNLVSRVASGFLREFELDFRVSILLRKRIPVGAGLGGGSSDAAALIRLLYENLLPEVRRGAPSRLADLIPFAARFGADIPYLLGGGFSLVEGVGERVHQLRELCIRKTPCCILVPERHCSTQEVFARYSGAGSGVADPPSYSGRLDSFLDDLEETTDHYRAMVKVLHNDLSATVVEMYPEVGEVLEELAGVPNTVSCLTGSGSASFILPESSKQSSEDFYEHVRSHIKLSDVKLYRTHLLANF